VTALPGGDMSTEQPAASILRGHLRAEQIKLPGACYERSRFWIAAFAARPFAWMAAAFGLVLMAPGWLGWPAAGLCLLIAQRHFQTLVHDASHAFYHRKTRINDPLADWLAAGWIGMTVANYRRIHLRHHAHNGSADDPEHVSFATVAAEGGLLRMVLRYACLLEAVRLVRKYYGGAGPPADGTRTGEGPRFLARAHIAGAQAMLAVCCIGFGAPALYLLWLYLALTWSPLLSRLRFLVEHPGNGDLTVTTRSSALERSLFAPLNFNFHFEHHSWPGVPPYRLTRAHRHLRKVGFYDRHPEYANASFLGALLRRRLGESAATGALA
jgi:fatty acid desaturase